MGWPCLCPWRVPVNVMQTRRGEPVPWMQTSLILDGSLILKCAPDFSGWLSVDIKIHESARLKPSHLTQGSWKKTGIERMGWHEGSEEHYWAVLCPGGVHAVPGAMLLLSKWKIKTAGFFIVWQGYSQAITGNQVNCKRLSYRGLRSWLIIWRILTNHLHASDSEQLRNKPNIFIIES